MVDFIRNRGAYNGHMVKMKANSFIALDHTFKVASNIGYMRPDKKWVTIYESAFLIMNELGQVMAWQLTKTTSMDEVYHLISSVQKRCPDKLLVIVDNCCCIKQKLQAALGQEIEVKLDLFHAVQRITKHMPKRHPFLTECLKDLKLVFRQPSDIGARRTQPTPDPSCLITNLDNFVKKWKECTFNEWSLIGDSVLKEVAALKVHINKQCLSNIPVKAGTNHNEAIHRVLNTHFSRLSKIGIPLALAIITIVLYQHNSKIQKKVTGEAVHLSDTVLEESENFGIIKKECSETAHWLSSSNLSTSCLDEEIVVTYMSSEVLELISVEQMKQIIKNSVNLTQLIMSLKKITCDSPLFNPKHIPFMSAISNVLLLHNKNKTSEAHQKQFITSILKAWGSQLVPVLGDGNCCFHAVATALILNEKAIRNARDDYLTYKDIELSDCASLSKLLRKKVVEEWLENENEYSGFVKGSIREEAVLYLNDGMFASDLGDTMILALANVLNIPITLFTSVEHHPIINILPRRVEISLPLFLA